MAQILKFEAGKPEVLALKFDTGKLVDGRFGEQFLYTTTDDRQFYLDHDPAHDVEEQMRRLGIRAGVEFRIGKIKTSHGGCRWTVERIAGVQRDLRQHDTAFHDMPRKVTAGAPGNTPAGGAGETSRGAQSRNESDSMAPAAALAPAAAPPAAIAPAACRMTACFKVAIDAIAEAQEHLKRKGIGITLSGDNITSAALSCYINECRNGGAR